MGINNSHLRGMGSRDSDPMRHDWFIDGYASERSRTIEPSQADDGFYLKLMASCLRVTRLLSAGMLRRSTTGGRCSVHGEICCEATARQSFVSVWSFVHTKEARPRTKLVNTAASAAALVQSGKWRQRCSAFGGQLGSQSGPTEFCIKQQLLYTQDREVNSGPFLLFANRTTSAPLYQCQTRHPKDAAEFISTEKDCEGLGVLLGILGHASTQPNSLTPRELTRCCGSSASASMRCDHVLDGECADGDVTDIMGYVV